MLNVTFQRDSRDRLSSVFAEGHVEIPESSSDEYSLVCAGVSAVLQAARLGLEAYAGIPLAAQQHKGELRLQWPERSRDDAALKAIVTTAELAVEAIAKEYPQHILVRRTKEG
jgi:uncharacterized protein YsxB (DUF464 family)